MDPTGQTEWAVGDVIGGSQMSKALPATRPTKAEIKASLENIVTRRGRWIECRAGNSDSTGLWQLGIYTLQLAGMPDRCEHLAKRLRFLPVQPRRRALWRQRRYEQ